MIVYLARAIQAFVMYCVNGTSRSSLLIVYRLYDTYHSYTPTTVIYSTVYLLKIRQDKNNYCRVLPKQIAIKFATEMQRCRIIRSVTACTRYASVQLAVNRSDVYSIAGLSILVYSCLLVETVVRSYHVYKVLWEPRVGETFIALHEINSTPFVRRDAEKLKMPNF